MKKLLSILLTLVMAICLVNLNNSHTKAEDNAAVDTGGIAIGSSTISEWNNNEGSYVDITTNTTRKNELGITFTPATGTEPAKLKLSKSLTSSSMSTLFADGFDLNIELTANVELKNNNNGVCIDVQTSGATNVLKLIGNGHTLTLTTANGHVFFLDMKAILNNITINVTQNNATTGDATVHSICGMEFDGKSKLQATANGNNGYAIFMFVAPVLYGDYEILGTENGSSLEEDLKTAVRDSDGFFKVEGDTDELVMAKYVVIRPKKQPIPVDPTPTPVKDESCEKVIGPTWHWNNDKGICEDYGVVGTYTR